jgi:hypothetical protein
MRYSCTYTVVYGVLERVSAALAVYMPSAPFLPEICFGGGGLSFFL